MLENSSSLQVDPTFLTGMLQRSLGSRQVLLGDWDIQPIYAGMEISSRIYRLRGQAQVAAVPQAWSLILKIVQPDGENNDPQGYHYWQREALAYQSGLLELLPGGIAAPGCYAVCTQPDGSVALWLEEVIDDGGPTWSLEQYASVARSLGEFNGAYLVGQCALPAFPWLSRNFLRRYLEHASPMVDFIRRNPRHPLVMNIFPGLALAQTLAIWDLYPRLVDRLDAMPQTFCHQDAFKRNLFLRRGQVVAIDWGNAGIAPVGCELAALVGAAFGLGRFPASQAQALEQACFNGYLEGLRRAGWQPDLKQVRLAFTLTIALRYVIAATIGEGMSALLDQTQRQRWAAGYGQPAEDVEKGDPNEAAYYQGLFSEILKQLGLSVSFRLFTRIANYALRLRR